MLWSSMPPGSSTTACRQSARLHQARGPGRCERRARQDRHAVIPLHPVHQHMAIAERLEASPRKKLVRGLGLLQAQNIRCPFRHSRRTLSIRSRIELMFQVTRRNIRFAARRRSWISRARKSNGARSGGKTGRLHVRSVWGKSGPQGRRDRFKESLVALSASE